MVTLGSVLIFPFFPAHRTRRSRPGFVINSKKNRTPEPNAWAPDRRLRMPRASRGLGAPMIPGAIRIPPCLSARLVTSYGSWQDRTCTARPLDGKQLFYRASTSPEPPAPCSPLSRRFRCAGTTSTAPARQDRLVVSCPPSSGGVTSALSFFLPCWIASRKRRPPAAAAAKPRTSPRKAPRREELRRSPARSPADLARDPQAVIGARPAAHFIRIGTGKTPIVNVGFCLVPRSGEAIGPVQGHDDPRGGEFLPWRACSEILPCLRS